MSKPRDSGRYNALTLRTRLTDLVEAKTNFIVAHEADTALVLITVPVTSEQFQRASEGFIEVGDTATLASVLAELSVRAQPDDGTNTPFVFAVDPSLDDAAEDPAVSGNTDAEFHEAEELPPGTADELGHEFEDLSERDDAETDTARAIAVDDEVYMLTDRRLRYKVVAVGTHVVTLSYIDPTGEHKYTTVPFGTFAWVEE